MHGAGQAVDQGEVGASPVLAITAGPTLSVGHLATLRAQLALDAAFLELAVPRGLARGKVSDAHLLARLRRAGVDTKWRQEARSSHGGQPDQLPAIDLHTDTSRSSSGSSTPSP